MKAIKETRLTVPELALVGGTRALLGAGLALLLADRLNADERRAVGWTLFVVGTLTTIPLAFEVLGRGRLEEEEPERTLTSHKDRVIAAA